MGVTVSGTAQRDAWQQGRMPPVEEVRRHVWSIPVPMPHSPLRYVIVYAFAVDDGVALIDAGWPGEESFDVLARGLTAIGYSVDRVRLIVVTHSHPDHYGLVARIRESSGAAIAAHAREVEAIVAQSVSGALELRRRHEGFLRSAGLPAELIRRVLKPTEHWNQHSGIPIPDIILEDGDLAIAEHGIRAVWTPGHTAGHTCYYAAPTRMLISGDHVLPRISPNISTRFLGEDHALGSYLESLAKTALLDVDEVLPAHEYRFIGHTDRIRELQRHHAERLDEVLAAVTGHEGATVWDLASRLSWARPFESLGPDQLGFILGETLSHLELLAARETVHFTVDPDLRWFRAA